MFFSLLVLLLGLVISGLTVIYVSYPRRGHEVPRVPWLGEALQRRVDALPTLDPEDSAVPAENPLTADHAADRDLAADLAGGLVRH